MGEEEQRMGKREIPRAALSDLAETCELMSRLRENLLVKSSKAI
jgi:hypothetical protein